MSEAAGDAPRTDRTTSTTIHPDGTKTIERIDRTRRIDGTITEVVSTTTVPPPPASSTSSVPEPTAPAFESRGEDRPLPPFPPSYAPRPQQSAKQSPSEAEPGSAWVPVAVPVPTVPPPPPEAAAEAVVVVGVDGGVDANKDNGGDGGGGDGGGGSFSRRKKRVGLAVLLLAIAGGVGAGVGIALSGSGDETNDGGNERGDSSSSGTGTGGGADDPSAFPTPSPAAPAPAPTFPNQVPTHPAKRPTEASTPTAGSCTDFNAACEWEEAYDALDHLDSSPYPRRRTIAATDDFDSIVVGTPFADIDGLSGAGTVRTYVRSDVLGRAHRRLNFLDRLFHSQSRPDEPAKTNDASQCDVEGRSLEGGGNFRQLGVALAGKRADENLGMYVDLSADGTILALSKHPSKPSLSDDHNMNEHQYRAKVLAYRRTSVLSKTWTLTTLAHSADPVKFGLSSNGKVLVIGYDDKTETYRRDGPSDERWDKFGEDIPFGVFHYVSGATPMSTMGVSEDGTRIAFGMKEGSDVSGPVVSYRWSSSSSEWIKLQTVKETLSSQEHFGGEVALSADGNVLAIATRGYPFGLVRTYTFAVASDGWTYQGSIKYYEEGGGVLDVGRISLSSDGSVVAIGNPDNDNNFEGHSPDIGAVTTHRFDASSNGWKQFGDTLRGEEGWTQIGKEVVLSPDGTLLAIGGNGSVRFFRLNLS